MRIRSIKLVAVAAVMFFSVAHHAQAITFNFSGTFSEANGLWEPFLQSFIGQTFSGSFTLASPENSVSSGPGAGLLELEASNFTVGSDTWTADNGILQQQVSGSNELTFWDTNPGFGNAPSFSGPTVTPFLFPVTGAFFFGLGPDLFTDVNAPAEFEVSDLTIAFFGLLIDGD